MKSQHKEDSALAVTKTPRTTKTTTTATETTPSATTTPVVKKRDFDPSQLVAVKNGFQGRLIYVSRRQQGVKTIWDSFGQEEYMELAELISARNTAKSFFKDNLWIIEDPEIIDFLGVSAYYKHSLKLEEFDEVLSMNIKDSDKIRSIIQNLSDGQKRTLAYRAKEKIKSGDIDSRKFINLLEELLGVELIER